MGACRHHLPRCAAALAANPRAGRTDPIRIPAAHSLLSVPPNCASHRQSSSSHAPADTDMATHRHGGGHSATRHIQLLRLPRVSHPQRVNTAPGRLGCLAGCGLRAVRPPILLTLGLPLVLPVARVLPVPVRSGPASRRTSTSTRRTSRRSSRSVSLARPTNERARVDERK